MAYVASSNGTGTTTSVALTIPASAAVGDVAWIVEVASTTVTLNTPSGWTQMEIADVGNLRYAQYRRVLTAGQPGSTVNLTVTGVIKQAAVIIVFDAVDNATQEANESPVSIGDNVAAQNRTNPVTTLPDIRDVFCFVYTRGNTPPTIWNPPVGWIYANGAYGTGSGAATVAVAYKNAAPAGAVGGDVWTSAISELRGGTMMIVTVPTSTTPVGPTLSIWNGSTTEPVELLGVWDGSAVVPVNVEGVWDGTAVVPV